MHIDTDPLVSIVITTYNRAHVLRETVDSALAQSYRNIEVIVVDDGSSDDTPSVMREYGSRVVSYRQANGGYPAARNAGLRLARGKYIAWLDSDDIFDRDKTALQVAYMERHPDVVLISADFRGFDSNGPRKDTVRTYYSAFDSCGDAKGIYSHAEVMEGPCTATGEQGSYRVWSGPVLRSLLHGSFVHPPTVMMRRSAVLQAGELDESLANSVEWPFFFRLARLGPFAFVDQPLIQYRFSPGQLSGNSHAHTMSASILQILRELPYTHPDVVEHEPEVYASKLADAYLYMSYVFARTHRVQALCGVAAAVRHGTLKPSMLKLVARILVPERVGTHLRRAATFVHEWRQPGGAALALALNYDLVAEYVTLCA